MERDRVFKHVKINAYFAHPELIILALIADEDDIVKRQEGVNLILNIKARGTGSGSVRPFRVAKVDLLANSYQRLSKIDIVHTSPKGFSYQVTVPNKPDESTETMRLTLPPLIANLSVEEIQDFVATPFKSSLPCHTQAVERGVKQTTGVVRRIRGVKRQNGESRGSTKARKVCPTVPNLAFFRELSLD